MNTFWSFLGHGGFKLLIFAFIIGGNILKARAKSAKQREATLRGNTGIQDFSTEAAPPAAKPAPFAAQSSAPPASAPPASAPPASAPPASAPPASAPPASAPPASAPTPKSAAKMPPSTSNSPWSNSDPFDGKKL